MKIAKLARKGFEKMTRLSGVTSMLTLEGQSFEVVPAEDQERFEEEPGMQVGTNLLTVMALTEDINNPSEIIRNSCLLDGKRMRVEGVRKGNFLTAIDLIPEQNLE